jgi:cobalt-zinc-cadmium efflux system outer membrane protein
MMVRLLLIGIFAVVKAASAAQPMNPPGLMPTAIARPLFEQDPGVAAARAGLDVALQEASILDQSPYEWTARVDGQQRRVENGPRYNEWFVGVEKTIRLPRQSHSRSQYRQGNRRRVSGALWRGFAHIGS